MHSFVLRFTIVCGMFLKVWNKYTRIDFSRAHLEDSPPPTYFLLGYFFFVNQVLLKDENWLPLSIWPHNRWTVKMNLGNRCRAIQWWWNQISNIFLHYRYKLCRKYVRVISIFFLEAETLGKSNPQVTIQIFRWGSETDFSFKRG